MSEDEAMSPAARRLPDHGPRGLGGGFWRLLAGQQLAAAPQAAAPIAFGLATLALTLSDHFNVGAAMVAAMTFCQVVFAVPLARAGRRIDSVRALRWMLCGRMLALLSITVASCLHAGAIILIAAAALSGVVNGTVFAWYRLLFGSMVTAEQLPRAVALSATANELVFVVGPVIAALLGVVSSTLSLCAMVVAALLPALLLSASDTAVERSDHAAGGHFSPALYIWLLCYVASATATSIVEAGAVALAVHFGLTAAFAAIFTVSLCVASVSGGAVAAVLGRSPGRRSVLLLLLVTMAGAITIGVGHRAWVAILGCALIGACLAPLGTFYSLVTDRLTSGARRSDAYSLLRTAQGSGVIVAAILVTLLDVATASIVAAALLLLATTVAAATGGYQASQEARAHV